VRRRRPAQGARVAIGFRWSRQGAGDHAFRSRCTCSEGRRQTIEHNTDLEQLELRPRWALRDTGAVHKQPAGPPQVPHGAERLAGELRRDVDHEPRNNTRLHGLGDRRLLSAPGNEVAAEIRRRLPLSASRCLLLRHRPRPPGPPRAWPVPSRSSQRVALPLRLELGRSHAGRTRKRVAFPPRGDECITCYKARGMRKEGSTASVAGIRTPLFCGLPSSTAPR
jgi:hypothetical protein